MLIFILAVKTMYMPVAQVAAVQPAVQLHLNALMRSAHGDS